MAARELSAPTAGARGGPGGSARAITEPMSTRPARGGQNPTMDQVAEAAGVSRATVSRVINGAPSVDAKIREMVQRAIAATGYVPNLAARTLSDPDVDPTTGVDLGAGPGAGLVTDADKGGATDIADAAAQARAK